MNSPTNIVSMGCIFDYFRKQIINLKYSNQKLKNFNQQTLLITPYNLHRYLNENDPNPKCIFIFGGSGSNKGQFIWEIMEQSCENFINDKNYELIRLLFDDYDDDDDDDNGLENVNDANNNAIDDVNDLIENNDVNIDIAGDDRKPKFHIDYNNFKYSYHYIDIERLIIDNLDERIEQLTRPPQHFQSLPTSPAIMNCDNNTNDDDDKQRLLLQTTTLNNNFLVDQTNKNKLLTVPSLNHEDSLEELKSSSSTKSTTRHRSRSLSDINVERTRQKLRKYSNIITNNWILTLIKNYIENHQHQLSQQPSINGYQFEYIYLINMIPNRLTIFRDCLFLRQTPSFFNFNYNYIAIKLIKQSSKYKELEHKGATLSNHNNNNANNSNELNLSSHSNRMENIDAYYIAYFRSIGKLYEICVQNNSTSQQQQQQQQSLQQFQRQSSIRLQLSLSLKSAIRISNLIELISFIYMPKRDLLQINICKFQLKNMEKILKLYNTNIDKDKDIDDDIDCNSDDPEHQQQQPSPPQRQQPNHLRTNVLFIINKEIELDDNLRLLIPLSHNNSSTTNQIRINQQYDLIFIRKFIQIYRLTCYALKFI